MINKIKLNLKDLLIFFISILIILFFLSDEKKHYISDVLVYSPNVPSVYINDSKKILDISLTSDKVYTPSFGKNLTTLQVDSNVAKMQNRCSSNVKIYNYIYSDGYFKFTMDSEDPSLLDQCFKELKNFYDKEWEEEKIRSIKFLNDSLHSVSKFSYLFHEEAKKTQDIKLNDFQKINGCKKIWEIPNTIIHIKKIIFDVCGNYYRIILVDKITDSLIKIEKDLLILLNDDFKNRGFKSHFMQDGAIILPMFLNQNLTLENLFSENNFNKEMLEILKLTNDKNYLSSFSIPNYEKDYIFDYDTEFENLISLENKSLFLKNLKGNLYDVYYKTQNDLMKYTDDFINYSFLNTKKEIFIPDDFRDSKLTYTRSENYLYKHTKTLESFSLFFTAIILSIFIMFFQKIILMFFNLKQNEKN